MLTDIVNLKAATAEHGAPIRQDPDAWAKASDERRVEQSLDEMQHDVLAEAGAGKAKDANVWYIFAESPSNSRMTTTSVYSTTFNGRVSGEPNVSLRYCTRNDAAWAARKGCGISFLGSTRKASSKAS